MQEVKEQKPTFCAVLTPYRALSPHGINIVIAVTCFLAAIPGFIFFAMGAWPIVGFLGVDILLLYWALTRSQREVHAFEEITLYPDILAVRKVGEKGDEHVHQFNPFWTKLQIVRDFEDRVTDINLSTRDRTLKIGAFLNPEDKKSFAKAFSTALYRLKN